MRSLLTIQGNNSPEFLERLLRVIRHRGFSIQNLTAETSEKDKKLQLTLTISSERDISLLTKQLEKIYGVTKVVKLNQESMIKASA